MTALLVLFFCAGPAFAGDDASFANYESIVSELKLDADQTPAPRQQPMDWDTIALQGSLGLTGALVSAPNSRRRETTSGVMKGFEVAAGANLFSAEARAELAFRNFANERLAAGVDAEMHEFEARLIFLPRLRDDVRLRMGFGLTERTLTVADQGNTTDLSGAFYALLIGAERKLAPAIAIGPDLAYRDSMSRASGRKSSWDASFRLNATF